MSRWLVWGGWPVHFAFAGAATIAVVIATTTQQPALCEGTGFLALQYTCGLYGSFLLHELAHAIALRRSPGVTALTLERTAWRISVSAHGSILGRDAFVAAAAGPGACVVVGLVLAFACPRLLVHVWFLGHALFLLPVFTDGRVLIAAARSWHRRIGCD